MTGKLRRTGYVQGGLHFPSPGVEAAILFIGMVLVNSGLTSALYRPDDIFYALQARWGNPDPYLMWRPEHLAWMPVGRFITRAWDALGMGGGPVAALQSMNVLCSAATGALIYLILRKITGRIVPSILGMLLLILSHGFWFSAVQAKMYPPGFLLLTLGVYLLLCTEFTRPFNAFLLGITTALAGLFNMMNFLLLPATLITWGLCRERRKAKNAADWPIATRRAKNWPGLLSYLGALLLAGLGPFVAVVAAMRLEPLETWNWLSRRGAPTGFFVTDHSLASLGPFIMFLWGALTGETQIRPPQTAWWPLACVIDFVFIPLLLLAFLAIGAAYSRRLTALYPLAYRFSLVLGATWLFGFWILDHTNDYNYVLFLPFALLGGLMAGTDRIGKGDSLPPVMPGMAGMPNMPGMPNTLGTPGTAGARGSRHARPLATWLLGLLCAALFLANYPAKIVAGHFPQNNPTLQKILVLKGSLDRDDCVVAVGIMPDSMYLQYFAGCRVIDVHLIFQQQARSRHNPYRALGERIDTAIDTGLPVYLYSGLYFMDSASSFAFLPSWMNLSKEKLMDFFAANYRMNPSSAQICDGQLIRLQKGSRPLKLPQ